MGSLRGDTFELHILIDATWTLIGKLIGFDKQSTRSKTTRAYFGTDVVDTTRGPRETTLTINGTRDLEDPGQIALYTALTADPEEEVELQVIHKSGSGYQQTFQIDDDGFTTAPDGFQDFSLTLSPTGAVSELASS